MLKAYRENERIVIGPPPKNPKLAWWALSTGKRTGTVNVRKLLDQMRDQGRFGGMPGTAPYWTIQEKGLQEVGIKGINYLKSAVEQWKTSLGVEVTNWIGLGRFGKEPY